MDLLLLLVNAYIALQPNVGAIAFTAVAQLLDAQFLERTALPRIHVIRRLVDQACVYLVYVVPDSIILIVTSMRRLETLT